MKDEPISQEALTAEVILLRQQVAALESQLAAYQQQPEASQTDDLQLRKMLSESSVVLWVADGEGIITLATGKGLKTLSIEPGRLTGRSVSDFFHEYPQIDRDMRRALAGEMITSTTNIGGLIFETRYVPRLNSHGQIIGVMSLAVDVTERQLMAEILTQSEERHRAAAELTSDYAYATQVDATGKGIHEWVTGSFTYITGFTISEVNAQGGWRCLVHFDDQEIIRNREVSLLNGQAQLSEFRIITRAGEVRWIEDRARPVWDEVEKRTVRIYGAAVDITERKNAEMALRQAHDELEKRVEARTVELARANAILRQEIIEGEQAEAALRQLQMRLSAVHQLGRELTLMHDEDTIVYRVLRMATDLLKFNLAVCGLVNKTTNELEYRYRILNNSIEKIDIRMPITPVEAKGIGAAVIFGERAINVPNTHQDDRYISLHPHQAAYSALCVPLRVGKQIIGVLNAESLNFNHFTSGDQQLLQTLADQTAVALENARLYRELQRRLEAQIALRQAGAAIFSTLELQIVLDQIAEQIGRAAGAVNTYISSYEADGAGPVIVAEYSNPAMSMTEEIAEVSKSSNPDRVFLSRDRLSEVEQPLTIYADDPFLNQTEREAMQRCGVQTRLIVPLKLRQRLIGYAEIWECGYRREFTLDEIILCQDIAQQAVVAIENARLHAETERRAKQLSVLHELDQAIAACLHIDDVYDAFARHTVRLLAYDELSILLREGDQVRSVYVINDNLSEPLATLSAENSVVVKQVLNNGRPLLHSNISPGMSFAEDETLAAKNIWSILLLPLRVKGDVIGVWHIGCRQTEAYTRDDLQIAQSMADQLAIAIEHARLFEAEQVQRRRTKALQAAGSAVSGTLDLNQVLDRLLTELGKVIPYDGAALFLLEENLLQVTTTRNLADSMSVGQKFEANELVKIIEASQKPLILVDVQEETSFQRWGKMDHIRGWMGVPLLVRDRFIGYFTLDSQQPAAYTQIEADLAFSFANQAAIAVENARLYRNIQQQMQVLEEAQVQLVQSERMAALGRLSSAIAHEINNPLQAIKNVLLLFSEALKIFPNNDRLTDYLNVTKQEIDRISVITQRMRNFYRPLGRQLSSGLSPSLETIDDFYRPSPQELQSIDLHSILKDVLQLVDKQLQQSDIVVKCQWADDVPLIQGNANHLKQVFLNLILNAIEGLEGQQGRLYLSSALDQTRSVDDNSFPFIRLEFSDTGLGISPEALPHLFEPFFSTKKQGSGLGLFISHKIVEAHNGQISVESQVGLGTTFSVLLPLEQPGNSIASKSYDLKS